jgi:hypothetical protein
MLLPLLLPSHRHVKLFKQTMVVLPMHLQVHLRQQMLLPQRAFISMNKITDFVKLHLFY